MYVSFSCVGSKMNRIDTSSLIKSVKSRPSLYDKHDSSYYSNPRKHKMDLWKEVCKEVYNWEDMNTLDRHECLNEVQKRWKNLRNCFTRELGQQRMENLQMETTGEPLKKRKKYEHFDELLFLIDSVEVKRDDCATEIEITKNISEEETSLDPVDVKIKTEVPNDEYYEETNITEEGTINCVKTEILCDQKQTYQNHVQVTERERIDSELVELIKLMKKEKEDEDAQFLMTLLPAFKKLNDKQKFDAKIGMLKVLREITFQEH